MKTPAPIKKNLELLAQTVAKRIARFSGSEKNVRLTELTGCLAQPAFWSQPDAGQLSREHVLLHKELVHLQELEKEGNELLILADMAWAEEDQEAQSEVEKRLVKLEKELSWLRFEERFDSQFDPHDCTIEIHAGAGGTESQDWVAMLLRMYNHWAEKHEFQAEILSILAGEEAGIKSVIMRITGSYAYGWLRGEEGVHRLVRISPFDAESRRHTSFASVSIYPAKPDLEIKIDPKDLKIDTFRASGAGGQHVNRTDSAVRITHLPTRTVVQCQNNRSQHQNKATALELLNEKLWKAEQLKQAQLKKASHSQKDAIGWGYQIRSYVLQPYQLIKDLRTNVETSNVQAVLDGEIDCFLSAYLDAQAALT